MNKKICFNLLGAWHGRPRLRLFTAEACPACHAKPCCLGRSGEQRRRVTKPVLSGAEGTPSIIEQCKSASAIYLKGVLHAVSFIEGR